MATILCEQSETTCASARVEGDDLWMAIPDAEAATGWALKPEGFCKGEVCVPVPPSRKGELVAGAEVNVAALWRMMGGPVARDVRGETWVLGTGAAVRSSRLMSLEAPDFSLPDLEGRQASLGAQRGRKVLLATWASW